MRTPAYLCAVLSVAPTLTLGREPTLRTMGNDYFTVGQSLTVSGDLIATGQNMWADGATAMTGASFCVGQCLCAAGGRVTVNTNGKVGARIAAGDVNMTANRLVLGSRARISGKFTYRSREALRKDPGAAVDGPVEQLPPPGSWAWPAERGGLGIRRVASWIWSVGLMLVAAVVTGAMPRYFHTVNGDLLPHSLVKAASGQWELSQWVPARANDEWWRIGAAIFGVFVMALIGELPSVEGLIAFATLLPGLGSIGLAVRNRLLES